MPPRTIRSSWRSTIDSRSVASTTETVGRSSGAKRSGRSDDALGDRGERPSGHRRVELAPAGAASTSSLSCAGTVTIRCSMRPVSAISTSSRRCSAELDELDVPDRGGHQRRVLDDRDLAGQLGEQAHRPAHDVVEVDGAGQEGLDGPALRRGQGLDLGEPVDEEAVALVRGDPPGATCAAARCSPRPPAPPCRCEWWPGETPSWCRSTRPLEPTGSWVRTKSSTMARRTASLRSSSMSPPRGDRVSASAWPGAVSAAPPISTRSGWSAILRRLAGPQEVPRPHWRGGPGRTRPADRHRPTSARADGENRAMLIVHVNVHVLPDHVEAFLEATRANHAASLTEPGVLRFDVVARPGRPRARRPRRGVPRRRRRRRAQGDRALRDLARHGGCPDGACRARA